MGVAEQQARGEAIVQPEAQAVAQAGLEQLLRHAGVAGGAGGEHLAPGDEVLHLAEDGQQALGVGEKAVLPLPPGGQPDQASPRLLELRADDIPGLAPADGEGDQGGGDIQVLKAAGHGILAADGGHPQVGLGL